MSVCTFVRPVLHVQYIVMVHILLSFMVSPTEEQFQTDAIEALTEIGMTLHLRELDFFTATYQSMEFLGVSRVESEVDVTPAEVEKVMRAKTKMAASRAVFICNQDTISSDRLIDLQNASCYFIKAGGYDSEKWKNHLISNFKETVGAWMEEQVLLLKCVLTTLISTTVCFITACDVCRIQGYITPKKRKVE